MRLIGIGIGIVYFRGDCISLVDGECGGDFLFLLLVLFYY